MESTEKKEFPELTKPERQKVWDYYQMRYEVSVISDVLGVSEAAVWKVVQVYQNLAFHPGY
ncbi:Protein of unknown function [Pyronema omphalodes CBS 100304]|uniref:Uncharacterized protein n=1 Tax=Pyronema omphalodes (strain CBS 100304) TaxID=1076935 RepID=U4LSG1_PYROM|nr:Protein of unknown function [Pyronema omphalodes CBS 100304]